MWVGVTTLSLRVCNILFSYFFCFFGCLFFVVVVFLF